MNKVQVGYAPSPNLKTVHSKIGSLANANHKPGGGNVKIESRKIQIEAKPRIGARNENYAPSGGDVKVTFNSSLTRKKNCSTAKNLVKINAPSCCAINTAI